MNGIKGPTPCQEYGYSPTIPPQTYDVGGRQSFRQGLPGATITLEFLLVERLPPVVRVTLRRPQEQNRINRSMAEEIRLVCQEISGDDSASLVVLTGAGESFSVGRESPWTGPDAVDSIGAAEGSISQCQAASAVAALPVPVLVVINGDAIDQGLELALAGDIRVCSRDARLGLTGVPNGEIPWDGGTQRLPRLVGPSWARDMILTGRTIDASQALAIGLVNRVEPRERLAPAADQLVQQMAEAGPVAARYAKEAITKGLDLTLSQGLGLEADLNVILQSTMDRAEGIRSFIERRSPRFTGQ